MTKHSAIAKQILFFFSERFFRTSESIGSENIMLAIVILPLGQLLKLSFEPARFGTICHQFLNSDMGSSRVRRYLYLGLEATCFSQRLTLSETIPAASIAVPVMISLSGSASSKTRKHTIGTQAYNTTQKPQLMKDNNGDDSPAAYPNSSLTFAPL